MSVTDYWREQDSFHIPSASQPCGASQELLIHHAIMQIFFSFFFPLVVSPCFKLFSFLLNKSFWLKICFVGQLSQLVIFEIKKIAITRLTILDTVFSYNLTLPPYKLASAFCLTPLCWSVTRG